MGIILLSSAAAAAPAVPGTGTDGTQIILQPNEGSTYAFQYRTDIHKSWSGRERRVALLGYARESFEAEFIIDDEETFRALREYRTLYPTAPYLMVVWHEGSTAQAAVTADSVVINNTYVDWAVAGQRVWVDNGAGTGFAAVVQLVSSLGGGLVSLALDAATPVAMPNGSAIVYPLRAFYLEDETPVGRYVVGAGRWSGKGRAVEPFTTIGTGATLTPILASDFVLDVVPKVIGLGAEDRPMSYIDMMDAGAKIGPEVSVPHADIFRQHQYQISTDLERQYWKKFLHTAMGRQKAFYLPTFRADLAIVDSGDPASLEIADGGRAFDEWTAGMFFIIRFLSTTGVVSYGTIDDGGTTLAGNSQFSFDAAIPAFATIATAGRVEKVRLGDDVMVWEYAPGGRQELTLRFLVVQQ